MGRLNMIDTIIKFILEELLPAYQKRKQNDFDAYYDSVPTTPNSVKRPPLNAGEAQELAEKAEVAKNTRGDWVRYSDNDGKHYYYNSTTQETTWTAPEGFQTEK